MPLAREWFCHSLWLWSEGKDLGMKPSGQEDKGQDSSCWAYKPPPYPQQYGQNWCQAPAREGEPKPEGRWQGMSQVQSPPPWDCLSQCPS